MSVLIFLLSVFFFALQLGTGHSIRIKRLRPFSISGFRYSNAFGLSISAAHVRLILHLPRPSYPRWATFQTFGYEYKDSEHHVSLANVTATLWILPLYFGFTGGSWVSVELNDFRLRVLKSSSTPNWVQDMRRNLVATILTGEIDRVDDFVITFALASLTGAPDDYTSTTGLSIGGAKEEIDELRISVLLNEYQTKNWQDRLYTFRCVQAQLRRSWIGDRGSYAMIAEESRWTKVQSLYHRADAVQSKWWRSLIYSIISFPFDVVNIYKDPMSTIDIYIPRLDVTFDDFRIRDAELIRQSATLFIEKMRLNRVSFSDVFFDAISTALS
ncbi:hypothetical protein BJ138DRAFT_1116595 [Hygrophoropsis aurantiaca]|uniref:Uncharacterized protein n=1 Tax=Hygrophoropsis aurantiaca TaxID=72124 RepID=A0ACB8A2Z0_9AGAM|nr:hypothetical protein BJ138DRAFT_1116595 [Hygrophoropsis aurantiaca]